MYGLIKKTDKRLKPNNFKTNIVINKINSIFIQFGIFLFKLLKNKILLIKLELFLASCEPSPTVRLNKSFNGMDVLFNKNIVNGAPKTHKIAN